MRAAVEESQRVDEELVPVARDRDLALLERDLARLEEAPIRGIARTRGVDAHARAYRRAVVRGEPLADWAKGRARDEIVRAALAILEALGALHDRGLVLGGVPPASVLVVGGEPVLTDLARLSEEPARVEPRAALAAEALSGARTDRRTDLHGVGTLLAALLPDDDLRALIAHDPHERVASAAAARALLGGTPGPEAGAEPLRAWHGPLVGRTSRLETVLDAARSAVGSPPAPSAPGIVLVHGAPGLGRTRFLDEVLVRIVREGVAVVRASGTSAGTRPLRVLADLLRALVPPGSELGERSRATLARLGLAEGTLASALMPESADEAHEARLQLADAIASAIFEATRGRPVALVIDDLDRCDAGSRFVVRHLARRLAAARKWLRPRAPRPPSEARSRWDAGSSSAEAELAPAVVLLASTSAVTGEGGAEAGSSADETGSFALDLRALAAESFALEVQLEPLDEDALATIAASITSDAPSTPRVHELARAARGNAGLLVQLARAAATASAGAEARSVEAALRARIDALEASDRALLVALVAFGRETDAASVAAVASGAPLDARARAGLARLVRDALARRSPGGYSVRPLVADVLRAEVASVSARLGSLLESQLESDPVAAAEWAASSGKAELLDRAAPLALVALEPLRADRRAATLALAWAESLLARGRVEQGVAQLHVAGAAFQRARNLSLAQDVLARATKAGEVTSGPKLPAELRARVWRQLGSVRAALGLAEASHAAFRRARAALARAEGAAAGVERARVLLAETEASLLEGDLDLAAERGEAGLKTLREVAAPGRDAADGGAGVVRAKLLALLGHVALLRDRPKEAETLLLAALAIDERHGHEAGAARTHQRLGAVALARGDLDAALAHWHGSLAIRERLGDRAAVAHLHANLSLAAARAGDLGRASELLRRSLRIREEMGDRRGRAASLHNLGYIAACRGELEEAVRALGECLALRDELGDRWYAASARNNLGQVLLDLGRTGEAEAQLEAALEARRALGDRAGEAASLANLSELALRRGDFARAIEREALARRMREGLGGPEDAIDQLRRGARLEVALGHLESAVAAAQRAVKIAKDQKLPLQEGPSRLLLGEALARAGKLDRAKRELERGRAGAERAGDRLTARRAEVELAALLVARGFPEDARALLDSQPVPFTTQEAATPLEVLGPLRVREQLLRARIELARPGGQAGLARRLALEAAESARAGEERELEWRALRAASAAAEQEGDEGAAVDLAAAAQEVVEALLANVPEARRETYLRADQARAAALRGDSALVTHARPAAEKSERPRIELRGAGVDDDAPTRGAAAAKREPARKPPRIEAPAARAALPEPGRPEPLTADLARADFDAITTLNRRILDEKDVAKLYALLVESAARLCGAERAFLAIFEAKGSEDDVELLAARGTDAEELRSSKQRFSRRVAKRAADTGTPVVTADVRDEGGKRAAVIGQGLRSVLAAPVRTHDARRGALYLDHRFQMGIFGARELRLVEAIADQCALAFGRGTLEERARVAASNEAATRARGPRPTVEPARFHGLVGRSASLRKAIAKLAELARTERAVLVAGPRGVGKEHAARALHSASRRAGGPFVVIDVRDAADATALEAALRGSEALPQGALGAARSGTLLFKALDAARPDVALALAHALDAALVERMPGAPRIVATASAPVAAELDALFAPKDRVELAPLSSRREDVPELAAAILERLAAERGETKTLAAGARDALARRSLVGEARELVASLTAAWMRAGSRPEILVEDLPPARSR